MIKKLAFIVGIGLLALLVVAGIVQTRDLRAETEPGPASPESITAALGSGFSYQGRVADEEGNPIDGECDLRFGLFDDASGGGQIDELVKDNQPVTDGLFAVSLDFSATAFRGEARWLELAVRCPAGSGNYTTLSPRQELSAVPYALSVRPGARIEGAVPAGAEFEAGLRVTNSSSANGIGIFGITTATSGSTIAVIGNNSSPDGFGVYGYSRPSGTGVRGEAFSGTGVWGSSVDWVGTYGYSQKYQGVLGQSEIGAGVAIDTA